ncbi:MAG: hypothetical protein WCS87_08190 [Methylococcaceae bacterium]
MKVVLTCGHPYSGFNLVHQALLNAGLKSAKVFKEAMFSPEDIQKKIGEASEVDLSLTLKPAQLVPGKIWQGLSTDLFIANLEQEAWGWADPQSLYLLNYWRDFDSQTRFVLVYASPTYALAQLLRDEEATPVLVENLCSSWARVNEELLGFYNRNQERCLLVNVEALSLPRADNLITDSRNRLGLNLFAPAEECGASPINDAVFKLLATSLLQAYPAVQELYQELESVADIICDSSEPPKDLLAQAYHQYRDFTLLHDDVVVESTQLSEQVTKLQAQLTQLQQELAIEKKKPELNNQLAALEKENELLLLQLHQVQEELEHVFLAGEKQKLDSKDQLLKLDSQLVKTQQELATEKKKPDLSSQLQKLQSQLAETQQELATEKKKPNLSNQLAAQEKENELLLLQLHQVQEELEHYFLEYQKALQGQATRPLVDQAEIDFRQFVDGDNWYDAEHDGRWAGPGLTSNLRLPNVKPGNYQIKLEIVDAITPEILKKTLFSLNNQPLDFVDIKPLSLFQRLIGKKKKYPITLVARADLDQASAGSLLEFTFPNVVSPASRGSQDMRNLALRIKTVELKLLS